jgi:Mg2+ and Co2+ transporter CorA
LLLALEEILHEQKELMLRLMDKIEKERTEIEVMALDDDFEDIDQEKVALKMSETPHTSHLTPHTSHLTPHTSHLPHSSHVQFLQLVHNFDRSTLSFKAVDLAQFFQDKISTVSNLLKKKRGNYPVDLLHCISLPVLEDIEDGFKRVGHRLNAVERQIHTIRNNFEARISSKNGEEQAKTNEAITWMTRLSIVVMPMNVVAGFFGMNVQVPLQGVLCRCFVFSVHADRFTDVVPGDTWYSDPFTQLVLGAVLVSFLIMILFWTAKYHDWRFGILSSENEKEIRSDPLKCLKNTNPWSN